MTAQIVAVTGTNGKTTVVELCRQAWSRLGFNAASVGSLGIIDVDGVRPVPQMASDPWAYPEMLEDCLAAGVDRVAFEAHSVSLESLTYHAVPLNVAAFTNLSRDHLDHHQTMTRYFHAKRRLFEEILDEGTAVMNVNGAAGRDLLRRRMAAGGPVLSYGSGGTINAAGVKADRSGQEVVLQYGGERARVHLCMRGQPMLENVLCSVGILIASGESFDAVVATLPHLHPPLGRLDRVASFRGVEIFVDHAHTPAALECALSVLRPPAPHRVHVIFGCGGDRDPARRRAMGRIAHRTADSVIITDDNPRGEPPHEIRKQILASCPDAIEIADRAVAIRHAVANATAGDVVLVAGKGHETSQIYADENIPHSDFDIIRTIVYG